MPRLSDDEVRDALAHIPLWTGDADRITRTVGLAPGEGDELRAAVMAVADAMDHHPVIDVEGNAMTFTVWTHSEGGVTKKDLDLADRIDAVVAGQPQPNAGG